MASKPSSLTAILAGGLAGASETVITYPAEFVKTRRQLPLQTRRATSYLGILRSTIQSQGVAGIYSGSGALIISNAAKGGVRFCSFQTSRDALERVLGTNNSSVNVLAGLSAGIVESILVVTPGEVIKTKSIDMCAAGSPRMNVLTVASQVVRAEGPLGLWKGLGPVLCKQGTNSAVRFASFGMIKDMVTKAMPDDKAAGSARPTLIAGSLSGVVTTYASMPFDNIKTRMQSMDNKHKNMFECATSMLRNEGVRVFWRATTPRLVRLTLSSGITFTVFDQVVTFVAWMNSGEKILKIL